MRVIIIKLLYLILLSPIVACTNICCFICLGAITVKDQKHKRLRHYFKGGYFLLFLDISVRFLHLLSLTTGIQITVSGMRYESLDRMSQTYRLFFSFFFSHCNQ